jgi:predicted DNA-binding transcriptional regulator AlpA
MSRFRLPVVAEVVGVTEVAAVLGVSRQRVDQLIGSYWDFPLPIASLAGGRVWERHDVEAWVAAHNSNTDRRPGRRKQEPGHDLGLLGARLRSLRQWRGFTIVGVAEETGVEPSYWRALEHGKLPTNAPNPSVAWLRDVAILFDQHPGLLMEDAGLYADAQRERLTRRKSSDHVRRDH